MEPSADAPGEGEDEGSSAIRAGLAGKRVLLTGVTGFLGQALFERLLSDFPETRLVLLVRPQPGTTARERAEELIQRPVFNSARARLGAEALAAAFEERVEVLEGDVVGELPGLPAELDVV